MQDELFAEVASRAQRLRGRVMALLVIVAIGLGALSGYFATLVQFALLDEAYVLLVGFAAAAPLAGIIKYAPRLIDRLLIAQSRAWIPELCLRHRAKPSDV